MSSPSAAPPQRLTIDGEKLPAANPADINVIYPKFLGGEPALTVGDIAVGSDPGSAQVLVLDITGT